MTIDELQAENSWLKDQNRMFQADLDTTSHLLSRAEAELKAYKKALKWALKELGRKEKTP